MKPLINERKDFCVNYIIEYEFSVPHCNLVPLSGLERFRSVRVIKT